MKISALQLPTESFLKDFIIILNNSEKDTKQEMPNTSGYATERQKLKAMLLEQMTKAGEKSL